MSSSVTDRPDPSVSSPPNPVLCPAELSEPSTSNAVSGAAILCEPSTFNSISCVTPEQVRPFPKVESRSSKRGGRKQGRCRIQTDTPEKKEIEEQHMIRMARKKEKS